MSMLLSATGHQENVFELARLAPGLPRAPARQNRSWRHKKIDGARSDPGARITPECIFGTSTAHLFCSYIALTNDRMGEKQIYSYRATNTEYCASTRVHDTSTVQDMRIYECAYWSRQLGGEHKEPVECEEYIYVKATGGWEGETMPNWK
ncbi:hypothetical protein B0H13DRAFT_2278857 [Mycena leptocephala]|nr:hypothetical protein B0H13DRAFT_2278857 [Mycena leptocephala]